MIKVRRCHATVAWRYDSFLEAWYNHDIGGMISWHDDDETFHWDVVGVVVDAFDACETLLGYGTAATFYDAVWAAERRFDRQRVLEAVIAEEALSGV